MFAASSRSDILPSRCASHPSSIRLGVVASVARQHDSLGIAHSRTIPLLVLLKFGFVVKMQIGSVRGSRRPPTLSAALADLRIGTIRHRRPTDRENPQTQQIGAKLRPER